MASYPDSVVSFTDPTSSDKLNSPSHSTQHININAEVVAIETELGVLPKGSDATVVARLDRMQTEIDAVSTDFTDDVFRISDDGDNTKKIAFQASGITTATVRTITMPDSNVDLTAVHTQNTDTGTSSDTFDIGDGTDTDKDITANNGDANSPALRYDAGTSAWQFANDGVTFNPIATTASAVDTGATTGLAFDATGCDSLTTGKVAHFESNSADASARNLVEITNTNTSAAGAVGLYIDQNADAVALNILTDSTTDNAVTVTASSLTTGKALHVYSNSASTASRSIVNIQQDNASATNATALNVIQAADAISMNIAHSATSTNAVVITASSLTSAAGLQITSSNAHINLAGDPTVGSPADGDIWYTGSALNFYDGSTTYDLLSSGNTVSPDDYYQVHDPDLLIAFIPSYSTTYTNNNLTPWAPSQGTLTSLTSSDLTVGQIGPCYALDGTNDYVSFADHDDYSGLSAISVEAWINSDDTSPGYILTKANGFSTANETLLQLSSVAENFNVRINGTTRTLSNSTTFSASTWYYYVATWSSGSTLKIYRNGVETANSVTTYGGSTSNQAFDIILGREHSANATGAFAGKLDGVRMLRREMSPAEILARYNTFK